MLSLAEFAGVSVLRDHSTDIFKISLWLAALRGSGLFIRPPFAHSVRPTDRALTALSTALSTETELNLWVAEVLGANVSYGIPQWLPGTSAKPRVGFITVAEGPYYYLEVHPGDRHLLYERCVSPDADPVSADDLQVMDAIIATLREVRAGFEHLARPVQEPFATDLELEY